MSTRFAWYRQLASREDAYRYYGGDTYQQRQLAEQLRIEHLSRSARGREILASDPERDEDTVVSYRMPRARKPKWSYFRNHTYIVEIAALNPLDNNRFYRYVTITSNTPLTAEVVIDDAATIYTRWDSVIILGVRIVDHFAK